MRGGIIGGIPKKIINLQKSLGQKSTFSPRAFFLWLNSQFKTFYIKTGLVLLLTVAMILEFAVQSLVTTEAAPKSLGTSTSNSALGSQSQKKTFFDSVNGKHWSFYYSGTQIVYNYSADGTTWDSAGSLAYNTANFAITYKAIAGTGYVFLTTECNTYDVCVRRGTVGANSISFGAATTVFDGNSSINKYVHPAISLSSDNYVWVAGIRDYGLSWSDHLQIFVRKSNAINNIASFSTAENIGRRSSAIHNVVLMPQQDSKMFLLENTDSPNIVGYLYDGSSWSEANDENSYSWFDYAAGMNDMESDYVSEILIDGTDVYIGGYFHIGLGDNTGITRYSTIDNTWNNLGRGLKDDGTVRSIKKYGNDLYVGGDFSCTYQADWPRDSIPYQCVANAGHLARWNTIEKKWYALGTGVTGNVYSIEQVGTRLYVGGDFTSAGGIANTKFIAKWDLESSAWSELNGVFASATRVHNITTFQNYLFIGGNFTNGGQVSGANNLVKFDLNSNQYSAVSAVVPNSIVRSMVVQNNKVYIGGDFTDINGNTAIDYLACWNEDTDSWEQVGSATLSNHVWNLTLSANNLYIGGDFQSGGGVAGADYIVRYDISADTWHLVSASVDDTVYKVAVADNGDLYAGGYFKQFGGNPFARAIAYWNGEIWQGIKSGIDQEVSALAVNGTDLYVGGTFSNIGGLESNSCSIARLDTITWDWHTLGNGIVDCVDADDWNPYIYSIVPDGDDVYIGGSFYDGGQISGADSVVKYTKSTDSWSMVGAASDFNGEIDTMSIDNNGVLYAGGYFTNVGGDATVDYLAKFESGSWVKVGTTSPDSSVISVDYVNGSLYVAGRFASIGGVADTAYIARWNGSSWQSLGGNIADYVWGLQNEGTDLYVLGQFNNAAGIADADMIARFDTTNDSWHAVGSSIGTGNNADRAEEVAFTTDSIYLVGGFDPVATVEGSTAVVVRYDRATGLWHSLDDEFIYSAYTATTIGDKLFMGGNFVEPLSGNSSRHLKMYGSTVAKDSNQTTQASSITDGDGNVHLTYTDENNDLRYREYDASTATWQPAVTIQAGDITYPSLSYDSQSRDLYSFWVEGNTIEYKKAVEPYAAANWDANPTVFYETDTVLNLTTDTQREGGIIKITWENGNNSPYTLYSDYLGTPSGDNSTPTEEPTDNTENQDPDTSTDSTQTETDTSTSTTPSSVSSTSSSSNSDSIPSSASDSSSLSEGDSVDSSSQNISTKNESGQAVISIDPTDIDTAEESAAGDQSTPIKQLINKFARIFFGVIVSLAVLSRLLDASLMDVWAYLYRLFLTLLETLGLRKKRAPWGIVYDSVTKAPIPLTIIRAFDVMTGKIVETNVTDKWGRYGFLLLPGQYKINARKQMYNWSSEIVPKGIASDDIYSNIYHGEDFSITDEKTVANFDTPADPIQFYESKSKHWRRLFRSYFKSASTYLFAFSILLSLLSYYFYRQGIDIGISSLSFVFVAFTVVDKRRHYNFGQVYDSKTKEPIAGATVKIFDAETKQQMHFKISDKMGRFGFLMPPGSYYLSVNKYGYHYPSRIVTTKNDGKMSNIYQGETLIKAYKDTLITANIPIDKDNL